MVQLLLFVILMSRVVDASVFEVQGVQFHPESIITDNGKRIVQNFVDSLQSKV